MAFELSILIIIVIVVILLFSLRIVNEYERGVRFFLGKYTGIMNPGLRIIIPVIMSWMRIDMRVTTVDVPSQECVSKDNISIKVNAFLYYRVMNASKAALIVEDYKYAVAQLSQTTMRNIVG